MKDKIKRICAYFLIVFNFIVGAISVYTTIKELTDRNHLIIVGIVAVLGVSGSIAYIVDKAYKPFTDSMKELSEGSVAIAEHYKIQLVELNELFKRSCKPHELQDAVLRGCHDLIKTVQQTIQNATGKRVRVCIKMIREDNNKQLYTYCRDNITIGQCRNEHRQRIELNENTDFANILAGNVDVFVGNDLHKDYKNKRYFNTSRDFKYVSTIVAPIRLIYTYHDSRLFTREYLGFLCVDSKQKNFFSGEHAQIYIDLIKATSHYLYTYISLGNYCYAKIIQCEGE